MPSIAAVDSTLFRHLTGRAQPRIPHPTANAFDSEQLFAVLPDDYSERDETLFRTALLLNRQVRLLRERYIAQTFTGLSRAQVVMLAVADANRGFLIIRQKSFEAIAAQRDDNAVAHVSALSQVAITAREGAAPQAGPDLNTALIDSLPHWFAAAAQLPAPAAERDQDFGAPGMRGEMLLSLDATLRDIWQEVLWEPWEMADTTEDVRITPRFPDEHAMWRVWDWREQSLLHQGAFLNRHLERRFPQAPVAAPIATTVLEFTRADPPVVSFGPPDDQQGAMHRSTMDMLEDAYVALFLDDSLTPEGVTPRLLARAVLVLQDLLAAALPDEPDPAHYDTAWLQRISSRMPRATIVTVLETALAVPPAMADALTRFLTADPWGPLGTLFNPGIWHRPLIAADGGTELMIVAGALVWGSPLRAVERWLQAGKGTDLTKTSNGLRYERELRDRIAATLADNPILAPVASAVISVPAGADREEIDLVVRIGGTLIVAEIKCFLGPTDPIDRYDYLRKLEEAAAQARRKAAWLDAHREQIAAILPDPAGPALRVVPLVIVNQSNGAGWTFEGCTVVDAKWFDLFLASGSYHSAMAFPLDGAGPATFTGHSLYTTAADAEAAIPGLFAAHPGLTLFREAVDWSATSFQLEDGRPLHMAYPLMNPERYTANFAIPAGMGAADGEGASAG